MNNVALNDNTFQFIVVANTGIQICHNFPLPRDLVFEEEKLWQRAEILATQHAKKDPTVRLLNEHISAIDHNNATTWISCGGNPETDFAYFRLVNTGHVTNMDIAIDTNNGAGSQLKNRIECMISGGLSNFWKKQILANIYVEEHSKAAGIRGSLVMDFGNSACTSIFVRTGESTRRGTLIKAHEPMDPKFNHVSEDDRALKKSHFCILRSPRISGVRPWTVMGNRTHEVIRTEPLCTFLYAPKKYIRHWPEHLKKQEPTLPYRGVDGQGDGLKPALFFVQYAIEHLLSTAVAYMCNPNLNSASPEHYPLLDRIMLTYPLTWRDRDKELFLEKFGQAVERLNLQSSHESGVKVELICSEPVAVAAYLIWEFIFQFDAANMNLINSILGNVKNEPELRILIVDIGGGSSDIAVINIENAISKGDQVDVKFKMVESMRFNRAGDRLTHIILTKIWCYLCGKYNINVTLDFQSQDHALSLEHRRSTISILTNIAEEAKIALSQQGASWTISSEQEMSLLAEGQLGSVIDGSAEEIVEKGGALLEITEVQLEAWVRRDRQSIKTGGEPGFMDIFLFLEEIQKYLAETNRLPHMVVLSGRTCRMSFIKRMIMESMKMPSHRVRELRDLLPVATDLSGSKNVDKLSVVAGAHLFRFGDNVRFTAVPEAKTFNRFIGTVKDTPDGLVLNEIHVRPGMSAPLSIDISIAPSMDLRIGHCFRENGIVEVIAVITNNNRSEAQEVTIDILDDYSVNMSKHEHLTLSEWVPGGNDIIVDNFYDTGRIDEKPKDFILYEVLQG